MSDYLYLGKKVSDYSLQELQNILNSLNEAEAKREIAKTHEKFKKMAFPPPNPEFVKLKSEIEKVINNA